MGLIVTTCNWDYNPASNAPKWTLVGFPQFFVGLKSQLQVVSESHGLPSRVQSRHFLQAPSARIEAAICSCRISVFTYSLSLAVVSFDPHEPGKCFFKP